MAAVLLLIQLCFTTSIALAKEKVTIAIISFSPYAPWYIVQEKGLAKDIEIDVQIIDDINAKNAGLTTGTLQCMLNTLDTVVVARSAGLPIKHVAIPAMSYGLDEMVVTKEITSVNDFPGKIFGADYGFLNHMWMLLNLKKADIGFDEVKHAVMLPWDSAAAFVSGGLDIDVNYIPFSKQSLELPGSHVLKTSLSDRTWERGLISESMACNEDWLAAKPDVAKEIVRAWFEAVNWWKENPEEGNAIVAKALDWPVADVKLTQYGAVMLNLDQNLGAFGIGSGKPVCASLPDGAEAREVPTGSSGWGKLLFDGAPDCVPGYVYPTWDVFGSIYKEAGVIDTAASTDVGIDTSILRALNDDGHTNTYNSNQWIGRLGE
jgi:NitT/TauT family transport system substrate-binding protein